MILFSRDKLRSQLASEAGIEMIEMIMSTIWSYGRSGTFLDKKFHSSICLSIPACVSWNLDAHSSLQKNNRINPSTQDRIELAMSFDSLVSSPTSGEEGKS
jgi:hypothetical protein